MNIKNSWVATTQVFYTKMDSPKKIWLVVSTPLKNISQIGNLPQIGVKIKNIWNHQPEIEWIAPFSPWPSGSLTRSLKCSSTNFASLSLGRTPTTQKQKTTFRGFFLFGFFGGTVFGEKCGVDSENLGGLIFRFYVKLWGCN